MYFAKITQLNKPKNQLEKAVQDLLRKHNRSLVPVEKLKGFMDNIQNDIVMLNREYYRCTALEINHFLRGNKMDNGDHAISVANTVMFFYKVEKGGAV